MNSDDYSPAPSGTFSRLPSIDPTKHVSYTPQPTAPTYSSVGTGNSEPQLTTTSQRSMAPDQLSSYSPVLSDVRPVEKSTNQINSTRGLDPPSGQAPGYSGVRPHYQSANDVAGVGTTESKQPTISDLAERERSNNGGESGDTEPELINPQDYVGISLVGKKFKQVNPEAYYVEKDDPYY